MSAKDIDPETIEHQGPLGRAGLVTRKHPTLEWTDTSGTHSFAVDGRVRLGSAEGLPVRVDDRLVSRLHAELELRNDGLWVRDLGSKNGTFINDILVEHARVPDGATLRVGETSISLRFAKAPTLVDLWPEERFGPLVGRSAPMRELFFALSRISPLAEPVLIEGETGTGKEVVARAIHGASPRAQMPFIVVDCGALPDDLMEAELFGHVRGAFTGALADREGSVAAANGGTLFLDEIGELPLSMQPKLLRLLETKTFRAVGATEHVSSDVRFLAATHRNLGEMVNQGTFREDLFFRLAVFSVTVPPLRSRAEDIPLLVSSFLSPSDREEKLAELSQHVLGRAWKGNVRELRNFINRARAMGTAAALVGTPGRPATPGHGENHAPYESAELPFSEAREHMVARFEKGYLTNLLTAHKHNVTAAAQFAGIDRTYLHRLMRKHGI